MQISTRKTIWWSLLAIATGGMLNFLCVLAIDGWPIGPGKNIIIGIPIISLALALAAITRLNHWYRREPFQGPGLWQLSLWDLLAISFVAGLELILWKSFASYYFINVGIAASLLSTAIFVLGLLTGSRHGIESILQRYVFAFGYVIRLFGALSTGGLATVIIVNFFLIPCSLTEFLHLLIEMLFSPIPHGNHYWGLMYSQRAGLICLPFGLFFCHYLTHPPKQENMPPPEQAQK